jgi:Putative adhesin
MTMSKAQPKIRRSGWIIIFAPAALIVPWSLVQAGRAIHESRTADPQGEVEIFNLAGKVEVEGWDRSDVEVGGTADDGVDRVDVSGSGRRTSIHVVTRSAHLWGSGGEAHLIVHVPAKSSLTVTLVSSDFEVKGVLGDLKVQSVSGNVKGEAGGDIRLATVSGNVHMKAPGAKSIEVRTISGDIQLTGGGGEADINTVSGTAMLELADLSNGRFKSISGDMTVALSLASDGRLESESVSGDVNLKFAAMPAAEFDVQTFSGGIKNCFGPKPMDSRYGPGSRLQFMNGEGHGHVRVNTKSGDARLCVKGMTDANTHASALELAQTRAPAQDVVWHVRGVRVVLPYVY